MFVSVSRERVAVRLTSSVFIGVITSETRTVNYLAPWSDGHVFISVERIQQDQYANYVIQKTLQLAPRDAALALVESIREHLPLMRNSSGGRRMLTKIAKRFPVSSDSSRRVKVLFTNGRGVQLSRLLLFFREHIQGDVTRVSFVLSCKTKDVVIAYWKPQQKKGSRVVLSCDLISLFRFFSVGVMSQEINLEDDMSGQGPPVMDGGVD